MTNLQPASSQQLLADRNTVVFPVLHGTFIGEDGTIQGMLDLAEVAYVGPDTLARRLAWIKSYQKN